MQNFNPYTNRQQPSKSPPAQTSSPFKPLNPRYSYQQQHSNYFEKLQEQLLEKSNRYTSFIGKKAFSNRPTNQAIFHKLSQFKQQNVKPFTQQIKPSKNNSFTQLSIPRKDTGNSSLHKTINSEEETKFRFTVNPSNFHSNHSRTNLHTELQFLQPRSCVLRQQTQRNHHLNGELIQQKLQQNRPLVPANHNPIKSQKSQYLKSIQLTNKIDHIKQVINNFNNAKKAKGKQKTKESTFQLQRKLVYNLTYEESNPSSLQDLPEGQISQSRMRKQGQSEVNLSKFKRDNLSSTISSKISINKNPNQSSKVSFFKKQKDHLENQYFNQAKQVEKDSINNVTNNKNIQTFKKFSKLIPQISNKMALKASIKQVKPMSIKDFIILAQIGQGKTGTVYMAKHIQSNFICALKAINRQIFSESVIVQLVRQIQIQFYLDHPNIVQLYAFFSDQSHIYLMLELCFSGNLYTHLKRQKILNETQIKPIIRQVCYALEFMHDNDIIHRDLKPQNILFHQNVVKICDLGWAVYSPLPRDTLCGTPVYASPELVQKKKYNSKIDVWNIGVMAYELLCGRVPFEIRSQEDLYKVVLEEIHFPKSIPVSYFCKDFIQSCLKKQPEKRKTITQLLEHCLLNESLS